ncbi:MAG: hypothetical protein ACRESS_02580 [Stenotrophobium sp.]
MTQISYEQFGRQLIQQAVSPARISRELMALLAKPTEGSVHKGGEMLVGNYVFHLESVEAEPVAERQPDLVLRIHIKGRLALAVKIVGVSLRFTLWVTIRLQSVVKTYEPVIIKLETAAINRDDIDLKVDPHDRSGGLLDKLNIIEPAVRDEIVDEVNQRINSDEVRAAATIDVLLLAEQAAVGDVAAPLDPGQGPAGATVAV